MRSWTVGHNLESEQQQQEHTLSLIILNVNGLYVLTERHRLAECSHTHKNCLYTVYNRPTSDIGTHTDGE